jgi:homoserine O-acetyltransferase
MSPFAPSHAHVEAYRSTGTSPGVVDVDATLDLSLQLQRASGPRRIPVRYRVQGPCHGPAVVVLGGISATRSSTSSRDGQGWWPGLAGPGLALDPLRHRLVGVDWIGGPSGPTLPCPVTPRDQAEAVAGVLDHLRLKRVSLVGASYGGMVALAFAAAWPHRVRRSVILCATHRPHPMATAIRSVQRGILQLGLRTGAAREAVSLARGLAMTTYRSAHEFEERFSWMEGSGPSGSPSFAVDEYLAARGSDFATRFDAESYLTLCTSIDLHDVDPTRITTPTTVVSISTDALAPPWLVDELAATAPGVAAHVRISSPFGHDAFLKEVEAVSAVVRGALDEEVVR